MPRASSSETPEAAIGFFVAGSFTQTNRELHGMLERAFPGRRVELIDVGRLVRRDLRLFIPGLLAVVFVYGPLVLLRRGARWRALFGTPWMFRALQRRLRTLLDDTPLAFTVQTQSLFDASRPGTPHFVYTDHTARLNHEYPGGRRASIEARISERWLALEGEIYRNAARVFTQSERAARSVVADYGADPGRVLCVHAGGHILPRPGAPSPPYGAKRILYVGTSWARKGGPELLAAFERVRVRHPDAELVVVGPSPRITTPGVRALGFVSPERLGELLAEASLFCAPTRREPLGFVFIEASLHRLPVVATRLGSLPDVVKDGETGMLVEPDDIVALADAISRLLADPALAQRMGERGAAHVAATWTWANTEQLLVGELRRALAEAEKAERAEPAARTALTR